MNGAILDTGSPRELITRHIEPNVIEVHGDELPWADQADTRWPTA